MNVSSLRSSSLQLGGSNFKQSCRASRALSNFAFTGKTKYKTQIQVMLMFLMTFNLELDNLGKETHSATTPGSLKTECESKLVTKSAFSFLDKPQYLSFSPISYPADQRWLHRRQSCTVAAVEVCLCSCSVSPGSCTAGAYTGPNYFERDEAHHCYSLVWTQKSV